MREYTSSPNDITFGHHLLVFLGPSNTIWQRMDMGLYHPRLGKFGLSHIKGDQLPAGEIRESGNVNIGCRRLDKPFVHQMGKFRRPFWWPFELYLHYSPITQSENEGCKDP